MSLLIAQLGNGYITTAVLREILKELDDKITNEDLDMMIEEIDSDGSGTVDFDGRYLFVFDFSFFLCVCGFPRHIVRTVEC